MKKLILLLAAVSVGFTSCWKEDESYKKLDPVKKGIEIYNTTTSQNNVASQQANIGVMFALLHAEAAKQGVENLNDVKVDNVMVKNKLFGSSCTITAEADGVYKLVFSEGGVLEGNTQRVGTLIVDTKGKLLKDADYNSQWTVTQTEKFLLKSYSSGSSMPVVAEIKSGQTFLYSNNDGSFTVKPMSITANFQGSSTSSDWSGSFTVKPADEGFAYSDCKGKEFLVPTGYAGGPTMYSMQQNSTPISMSYGITDGKYLNYYIIGGEERCEFTGNYDMLYYFPADVTYEWGLQSNGKNRFVKVSYNGQEVTENL